MSSIAGIHIFSDKKAKILTALKASLREAEKISDFISENRKDTKNQFADSEYQRLYDECENSLGDVLSQSIAIVLYDDYVTLLFEDAEISETERQAAQYSNIFGKPVLYTVILDDDTIVFGASSDGKLRTRRVCGEYLEEYDLVHEKINMDYLTLFYNAKNLTDLNTLDNVQDVIYTLEEDYGIYADISPISVPLFEEKYKLLEKSTSFSVYSAL